LYNLVGGIRGHVRLTPITTPTVTIQVQSGMQQGANGFVLIGNPSGPLPAGSSISPSTTTNLTATGNPSGGTFSWNAGPKLSFQGPTNSANSSVAGTNPSQSSGDTWVRATYTQNSVPGTASIRFTVREPYTLVSSTFPSGTTVPYTDQQTGATGYVTYIYYYIYDQPALNTPITTNNKVPFVEIESQSVVTPSDFAFNPPDGTACCKNYAFNSNGYAVDNLIAA